MVVVNWYDWADPRNPQILKRHETSGGGFKYVLLIFIPILGEMIQFDQHVFQMGGSTTKIFWAGIVHKKHEKNILGYSF